MFETMDHRVEIKLNVVKETYFRCYNTAEKLKRFDFVAVFQQHIFILQAAKFFLKPREVN